MDKIGMNIWSEQPCFLNILFILSPVRPLTPFQLTCTTWLSLIDFEYFLKFLEKKRVLKKVNIFTNYNTNDILEIRWCRQQSYFALHSPTPCPPHVENFLLGWPNIFSESGFLSCWISMIVIMEEMTFFLLLIFVE